jgi:hypothetical protein
LEHGAARVTVTPLHLPDWLAMAFVGMGPAMLRTARAIREARRAAPAPLLVVGHSAGGLLARLAMSPEPIDGRRAAVADAVGCLVTLGTPHRLAPSIGWRHPGVRAAELLERTAPGCWHAPTTGYVTVGSTFVAPRQRVPVHPLRQGIGGLMRVLVGPTPGAHGDGIVDVVIARLDGALHVELPDVLHGTIGGPWYGDAHVIDRWWPAAVERWRAALAARATMGQVNAHPA